MYSKEEFDKEKTKVLKYILYKKRSEYEIRNKFSKSIEENLLDDIIEYLKVLLCLGKNFKLESSVVRKNLILIYNNIITLP